jgi:Na+-transporting methylmalonyl-CoA/oxaloacetate decarboxylase gamma subunit
MKEILIILNLVVLLIYLITKTVCSIEYFLWDLEDKEKEVDPKKEEIKPKSLTEEEYRNYIL